MAAPRIQFSVQAAPADPVAWLELARRVEDLGFHALDVADHVGTTADPFAALAAAATVTSTLRLGTYVLNAGVRVPLSVASSAATVDALSGGRLLLGLGAGHTPAEWTMLGRPYPNAGERVRHLEHVVDVVRALWRGEVVTRTGPHARVAHAFLLSPRPVQPELPLLIGGNGPKVLALGGRCAQVVSVTGAGATLEDGHRHAVDWSPASIDSRVAAVRAAVPSDREVPVLDALVQHVAITDRRDVVAEHMAKVVSGLTPADALGAPYALLGSVGQLVDELEEHRERWGFTSYVVRADAIGAAASLLDVLR